MSEVVYSAIILDHFRHPRNVGDLESADRSGEANNPVCGDRVRIAYRLRDGRVTEVRFRAEACAICTAAASLLTERMHGATEGDLAAITERDVLHSLNSEVPPDRHRCATLPLEALGNAAAGSTQQPESE